MKFSLGRITFVNKVLYYFTVILISIPFIFIFIKIIKDFRKYLFLILWIFVPICVSFLLSGYFPLLSYFRLLFIIPAFYILLAIGIWKNKNYWFKCLLSLLFILINIASYFYYVISPSQQRENWRGATSYVESKINISEIVIFSYPEPFAPYRWYEKKPERSYGATDSIYAGYDLTTLKTENIISGVNGLYYFEYLKDISDPNSIVLTTIKNRGFKEKEKIGSYDGVGYIYYFTK
jgi:hypothetical protein